VLARPTVLGDDEAVASADEQTWFSQLSGPDTAEIQVDWREWLHDIYTNHGPLEPSRVLSLARDELLRRAQEAAVLVADDARATLASPAEITATFDHEGVRVVVNGQIASGVGLMAFSPPELLVEVADYAQEMIMDDSRVWPECLQHDAGLHPELDRGQAVWMCRVGRHPVAPIGQLRGTIARSPRAAKRRDRSRKRR
jgi:PAS domain-containing protein